MLRHVLLFASATAAVSATGCATADGVRYGDVVAIPAAYDPEQRPLSIGEIAADLRNKRSQSEIADEVRERGMLAPVTPDDLELLRRLGADEDLVDAVSNASYGPPQGMGPPPAVYATPVPEYRYYPYAPYTPYVAPYPYGGSFFFFRDFSHRPSHRFRDDRHRFRGDDHDRFRPDHRDGSPRPSLPAPNWQSPRSPGSARPAPSLRTPPSDSATPTWPTPDNPQRGLQR